MLLILSIFNLSGTIGDWSQAGEVEGIGGASQEEHQPSPSHPQPDTPQSHSERGGLKVPEHFFVFLWKKPPLNCQHDQKVQWPEIHCHLLQLLLGADVGGVPARLLAAVGCTRMEASVALPGKLVFQFKHD